MLNAFCLSVDMSNGTLRFIEHVEKGCKQIPYTQGISLYIALYRLLLNNPQ